MKIVAPSFLPDLEPVHRGKVRDTYELADPELFLMVATDRVSTHNIVHNSMVPKKGEVLTALTIFWLTKVLHDVSNQLIAFGEAIYKYLPEHVVESAREQNLHLRAIVVKKLRMIPVEFIGRMYLSGSLYENFYRLGRENPYGIQLPAGLEKMSPFPHLVFTPTDKSADDNPLNSKDVSTRYGKASFLFCKIFDRTREHLNRCGIELVDTKMEFGLAPDGEVFLADEVVTPDSSRFCEMSSLRVGVDPPWLDKQLLRDEAVRIWVEKPRGPVTFADEIIDRVSGVYVSTFERVAGKPLADFQWHTLSQPTFA